MAKNWKNVEREIAKILGGERIPITGRVRDHGLPDIQHKKYSIEVKHRKVMPKWLSDYLGVSFYDSNGNKIYCCLLSEVAKTKNLGSFTANFAQGADKKRLPKWLDNAIDQATKAASKNHKALLVVLHQKQWKFEDSVCFLIQNNDLQRNTTSTR